MPLKDHETASCHFKVPEVGSPPLVQRRTDEMRKRLGLNLAFLLDGIHIHPKSKPVPPARRVSPRGQMRTGGRGRACSQCLDVGREARHTEVHALCYGEYLGGAARRAA